ncbi:MULTISPECIES: DoxX family protein [unclassified Siphonobacter]|uniref:DoxX family protein n=1 Tax=unclassified Siphonobacter TaxID=2635712 RepID=UPI002788CC39|nr:MULTISPECIES: DoxX family protein [unclassified Siphonobacter]MDQ1090262.1 hypothetical protein [Siphonobacter sp. SORGH_AS_1065]MDR6198010.1 hypothetical protein [Siphonobacter sp. SORGH_AS_0500]
MKIISLLLLLVSAFLSIKHGWDSFQATSPEQTEMMTQLGINKTILPYLGVFSIVVGLMLFFPPTFFLGNSLNAISIVLLMAFALNAGQSRFALMEIPFLALPLVLIWLKHPLEP